MDKTIIKKEIPSSWKYNVLLLILSVIIAILVLETTIRTYDMVKGYGFFSGWRNSLSKNIQPVSPFRIFGFELYKNEDGVKYISSRYGELYPIRKPAGTFRIVVFGGSTTENGYSYREEGIHYPVILQSKLRESFGTQAIEVINVGNGAFATPHSLILFELDVLSWKPDMIIVSHNINDLQAAYWPNLTFDYSNKYSNKFFMPDYKSVFTFSNLLFQHSQFYWFIRQRINGMISKKGVALKRMSYGMNPPQLAINIFKRNLRSFIAIAKENGIKVLLGNQPLQPSEEYFVRHMGYISYNSIVTYPLHNEFVHHHEIFNEAIRQVAEETGVLFIDNKSKLGENKEYFIDFVHYTPKGINILASNYAKFIIDKNIIQMKGRQGERN